MPYYSSVTATKKYVKHFICINIRKLESNLYSLIIRSGGLYSDNLDMSGAFGSLINYSGIRHLPV